MLVAREAERQQLVSSLSDEYSQFIAVYGRRRVGKTFLVRESFGYEFTFQHAGLAAGSLSDQLYAFAESLKDAGLKSFDQPSSWLEAFALLKDLVRQAPGNKKVIFIDELSWMDTPKSGLVTALENFWNGWASGRKDIVLVVCASATSWMLNKIVHNKGGLYNRLTKQIHLQPFTLGECEQMLAAKGIEMNMHQVLECYMIMGGVPFYWDFLKRGKSLAQNIDAIFFAQDAPLKREFDHLYASLFKNPEDYLAIVSSLAKRKAGMTREEILAATSLTESGALSRKLEELESCGFLREYRKFGNKQRGSLYQLVDNYTLFYYKFLENGPRDECFWENSADSSTRNAWCGLAFERVCLEHVPQIKRALGISGVLASVSSWSCKEDPDNGINGSQIDLLIDRKDQVINLCEMKFATDDFAITKAVEESLRHKVSDFKALAKTRSAVHVTLITTYGLKENRYSGIAQSVVTADDLFAPAS
ncbi:MAG: ATP-binding protein [Eggerthellaceae bacterium]|nr:ATP-binding protein [Eggerthellaceae bacterium]MBQ9068836.1 ATP-binding protein [Eggerthellaceae bacterium]